MSDAAPWLPYASNCASIGPMVPVKGVTFMSVLLSRGPRPLQNAIRHVQNDDTYRFFPLYSVLLMLIYMVLIYWPLTDKLLVIYREYNWIIEFTWIAEACVLWLSLILGIIGFIRRGLLPKVLSVYAVYHSFRFLFWRLDWPMGRDIWMDFTWYAFDVPIAWIHQTVGTDAFARTSLYAVYLLALYLLLRPLAKRLWLIVLRMEDRLIARYPLIERWKRPIL
jgi:hypothetical protein